MTEWIARHVVKIDRAEIGISVTTTGVGIGAPRIWSKPVTLSTDDYGVACDAFIAETNDAIEKLEAVKARFENAKMMYELTGEIPDEI